MFGGHDYLQRAGGALSALGSASGRQVRTRWADRGGAGRAGSGAVHLTGGADPTSTI